MTKNFGTLEYATIFACKISYMSPELLDSVLLQTDFPELELHASGKVRDVYNLDDDRLLFEFLILEGAQAGLSWETIRGCTW